MTDLEMTKLCAEAIGIKVADDNGVLLYGPFRDNEGGSVFETYEPLDDDAQCMALMKRFCLDITPHNDGDHIVFFVRQFNTLSDRQPSVENDDLNRAIVECVAKMQVAKTEAA